MGLRLEIVSDQREDLGQLAAMEFDRAGGTIGRSLANDWALPDSKRIMSAKHAVIDYYSGSYYLIDTSTNGVFINGGRTPVGRGNPQRLFNGDKFRLGEYLIRVQIVGSERFSDTLVGDSSVFEPIERAQLVESATDNGGDLLDSGIMTGPSLEIELVATHPSLKKSRDQQPRGQAAAPQQSPAQQPAPARTTAATAATRSPAAGQPPPPARSRLTPVDTAPPAPATPAKPPAEVSGSHAIIAPRSATLNAALDSLDSPTSQVATVPPRAPADRGPDSLSAFFRGACIPLRELSQEESDALLFLVGQLLREMLTGLTSNLNARAQQKSALRMGSTAIQPRDNNPLKFVAGASEAIENLLFREKPQYTGPITAARGAFDDIRKHQEALFAALPAALGSYLAQLDPDTLEDKFNRSQRHRLMGGNRSRRYWELYREMYTKLGDQLPANLPPQFVEELALAYATALEQPAGDEAAVTPARAGNR